MRQIESLFPREEFIDRIDESYDDKVRGRKRTPAIVLVKMMILQYVFGLSDESVQEDVYDRKSFYEFI